jgi:hypothetical protein
LQTQIFTPGSNQKTVLLASFIDRPELENSIKQIKENFVIIGSKIFVLKNKEDNDKLILTYNILLSDEKIKFDCCIPGTIALHRKKETNTLYTLNSLNTIIMEETQKDVVDKSHKINWTNYLNCILITHKIKGLIKIETELETIINFENVK